MRAALAAALAWLAAGRRLTPDERHYYAPDSSWPSSCWCGNPDPAADIHIRPGQ